MGFPPAFLTLCEMIQGSLPMRFSESVLIELKPAFHQAAEEPAMGLLKSLRFHSDQRVEKVKAYGSYVVHGKAF